MQVGQSKSILSRYKTTLSAFLIITLAAICILRSQSSPPSRWIRYLEHVAVVDVAKNRLATIFNVVLSSYNISSNSSIITNLMLAPPEGRLTNKTGRYVSMHEFDIDNRRLGNQLFNLAAMLHTARLTGRRVAMVRSHPYGWLDSWFEVPVTRVDRIDAELCPCVEVGEAFDISYHTETPMLPNRSDIIGKSLLIRGYSQSWKYTVGIESELRYHLRLLPNVSAAVHSYLDQIRPSAWTRQSFSRIGIHVRAGDIMQSVMWNKGFTTPQRPYFEQAMSWFVNQQQQQQADGARVQFIVTTDSLAWVKKAINFTSIADQLNRISTKSNVHLDLTHSEGHDAGFDLALLSLCDGVIMSTGTYGWWGAWLANKTTIYYSNWPRAGSPLYRIYNHQDYFPPNWIPIGGPAFPCCAD